MTTVLIASLSGKSEAILNRFRDQGWEVRISGIGPDATDEQMRDEVMGADATIAGTETYSRRVIEAADRLKIISRTGVGYDAIDVEAATERGIVVATTPGTNHKSVADYAVMAMLALTRRLIDAHENVARLRGFDRPQGHDFFGATVGVIGTGAIGKQVIQRVRAFDCPVLAHDIVEDPAVAALEGVRYVSLDELLRESDFVTIHIPASAETYHFIGAEEISMMKPSAYLLNTARGPLLDESAAYEARRDRRIAGAALDVFEREPLDADSPLHDLDNLILTPHIAGVTAEFSVRAGDMAAESVIRVLRGEAPVYCVNPEVLHR